MRKSSPLMNTKPPEELHSGHEVAIWCARMPEDGDSRLWQSYLALLTSEEKDRYNRFAFEKDRRQFLLTRALARDVLSRYLGVEPSALVFNRNKYGKPSLAEPPGWPLRFSLSHTKGLSVCAIVSGADIGVDVENLQRSTSYQEIAYRFFAASESAYLAGVGQSQRRTEFLKLWTLKEAFIKARGLGLSIPLNSFEISLFPDRSPAVYFSEGQQSDPANWQFLQLRLGGAFQIGVALLSSEPKWVSVHVTKMTPLTWMSSPLFLEPNDLNEWELGEV